MFTADLRLLAYVLERSDGGTCEMTRELRCQPGVRVHTPNHSSAFAPRYGKEG